VSKRKRQTDQFDRDLPVGCVTLELLSKCKHQLVSNKNKNRKVKCYPCTNETKHMEINANELVLIYARESIRSFRNGNALRLDVPEGFSALNGMPEDQETCFAGIATDHVDVKMGSKPFMVVFRGKITSTNTGTSTIPFGCIVLYAHPDLSETDTNSVIAGRIRVKTVPLLLPPVNSNDLVQGVRLELQNEIEKKDNEGKGEVSKGTTRVTVGTTGGLSPTDIYEKIKKVHSMEAKTWGTSKEEIAKFQTTETFELYQQKKNNKEKVNEVVWMELSKRFRLDLAGVLDRVVVQERFNEKLWVREIILHYLLFDAITIEWLEAAIKVNKAEVFKFWRQQAVVNCLTETMTCVLTAQNWSELRRRKNLVGISMSSSDPGTALNLLLDRI